MYVRMYNFISALRYSSLLMNQINKTECECKNYVGLL
jgi:hypothetical protein